MMPALLMRTCSGRPVATYRSTNASMDFGSSRSSSPDKLGGLNELARAAAMSRTSFAERFRDVAGMPPRAYLNRWRMMLARRALRDADVSVGSLATDLGYASESAFSTAFKREVGESPLRYRYRVRDQALSS
jgi:AraC-like DNA-binding protein